MYRLGETKSDQNFLLPAAITDTGLERDLNEDRYCVLETKLGIFWAVFDGLGGAAGGEVAAQIAMDAFLREVSSAGENENPEQVLISAVREANRVIILRRQNPTYSNMGTTIVAALITPEKLYIANVGDSRAYLLKENELTQLTIDHTLVQMYVDQGKMNPEDALRHPESHVLTKCLGSDHRLIPDTFVYSIYRNSGFDTLVLCTDGLYSLVSESEICKITKELSPQAAVLKLVELAKNRGGFDNITVAIIPLPGKVSFEDSVVKVYSRYQNIFTRKILYIIAILLSLLLLIIGVVLLVN